MEKLEKAKKKHDHKGTKILKLIIFACVMLAPFFSILTRCMYVSFNPNAKDSYSGSVSYVSQANLNSFISSSQSNLITEYQHGNSIYYKLTNYSLGGTYSSINYTLLNINDFDSATFMIINVDSYIVDNVLHENTKSIALWRYNFLLGLAEFEISYDVSTMNFGWSSAINGDVKYLDVNNNIIAYSNTKYALHNSNNEWVNYRIYFTNVENNIYYFTNYKFSKLFELSVFFTETTLSNAFEYAVNNIKNQDLYNWTQNTGIYNGINAMCTGLGVNNVIAILLTYWALCTAIYIIFDIVIELFTKLTHFINAE